MSSSRRRVLLVLADSSGGIGRHVRVLAAGLPARGVDVSICAPESAIRALALDKMGVTVIAAPVGVAAPSALLAAGRSLRSASARVDLAHAHGLRAAAACGTAHRQTPLVATWHNGPQGGKASRGMYVGLSRYAARRADLTLAASPDLAALARRRGAGVVADAFVVAPTLAAGDRDRTRAALGVQGQPLVLAVGRLHAQKRLDVLVTAAAGWVGKPDSPTVVIVGEGPDAGRLEAQIAATGAPVRLLGARTDMADLFAAADVLALPSEWEARALVAQEALRAGVPLVTAAVGGLPDLVGDAAVMVPVGDARALRQGIERAVGDDELRKRLITEGVARASQWPTEAMMLDDHARHYLEVMSRLRL